MAGKKANGILLDVDYVTREGKSVIRFFVRQEEGVLAYECSGFSPYFFVTVSDFEKAEKALKEAVFGEGTRIASVERVEKANAERALKLGFDSVQQLVQARAEVSFVPGVTGKAEHDIPFAKRWLLDNSLEPMNGIEFEVCGGKTGKAREAKNVSLFEVAAPGFRVGAFDLETYSPGRFSDPKKDPVLMASFAMREKSAVLSYGKNFSSKKVKVLGNEAEMLSSLAGTIKEANLDILATYNGDLFDFPYLKERTARLGQKFGVSSDGSEPREQSKGRDTAVKLAGMQHLDVYQMLRFLSRFAVVSLIKFDLESVVERLYNVKKEKVTAEEINEQWDQDKNLDRVAEYCAEDSEYTLKIGEQYLPLLVELCRIVKQPLFDVGRASASILVEYLIMDKCRETSRLIANKPDEAAIRQRLMHPIKGGYVKEPESGLHENLAVLDFSSLYPTIMISHNVSPDSLGCRHDACREKNSAPNRQWFCLEKKGLVPEILKALFEKRMEIKKQAKTLDRKDKCFVLLNARQHALKILLNSFYGYLGYSRSRFYCRECASAITAWARQYVQWVGSEAEKAGFKLLYSDSISRGRFVTVLNPGGLIEVKNVEELFNEAPGLVRERGEKGIKPGGGYSVLSIDPETGRSEWANIKEIIRHKTGKKLFRVNQKFGETIATEDHSIIVRSGNKFKNVAPQEMRSNRFFAVEKIPPASLIKRIDLFELLKYCYYERVYKGRIKISQWHKDKDWTWFGFTDQKNQVKVTRFIETNSKQFEALCRILGAYIAEGSSSTVETCAEKRGASIASSNSTWLKDLEWDYHSLFRNTKTCVIPSMKKKRFLRYGKGKEIGYIDKTLKLQMMNETSAVFFKALCGQKSTGKKLPAFILNVPDRYKRILLKKMVEGDGTHSVNKKLGYSADYIRRNFGYTTNSLALISGLSLLLRQLGINYSMQYRPEKKAYTIKTSTAYNKRVITKITEEKGNGFVYDLAVEKNNNFVDACGQILLHNTDSAFLIIPEGRPQDSVRAFVEGINKQLPGVMNLELEGFFKRGIFVTKESGEGAKKKYALMDYDGNLKIVGFEYVRRDWSRIAKETQRKVIMTVLSEGKPEKAVEIVKKTIKDLRESKIKNSELVVFTQIKRKLDKYDAIGPHVAAAKKAVAKGHDIDVGSIIGYIVTKCGKSISDKAQLQEYVREGNYDADYYIEHQVVPAVIKIMQELGYSREDLIQGGKQHKLASFFG